MAKQERFLGAARPDVLDVDGWLASSRHEASRLGTLLGIVNYGSAEAAAAPTHEARL